MRSVDIGEPTLRPVNVAWRDVETGEVFEIRYAGEVAQ